MPSPFPRGSTRLVVALLIAATAILGIVAVRLARSPVDPETLWKTVQDDLQAGRFEQARAGLQSLERLRKPTAEDWLLRSQLAEATGDTAGSLEALQHVPEDHPLGPQAFFLAGLIERKHNRLRIAEAAYRKALALDPGLIKAHKEMIYILGMQFRRREVDAEFKALLRLTPLNHHDLHVWCLTHFIVWGPDSAQNLESFIQADPEDRYSRLALATLLISQPDKESEVERVLQPLPDDDPEALALRVELRLNHGRTDEALAMLSKTRVQNCAPRPAPRSRGHDAERFRCRHPPLPGRTHRRAL